MKLCSILAVILVAGLALGQGTTNVKGGVRKDGTYVAPHKRTKPNGSRYDNWSSKGNTNPYTGKKGTKNPSAPKKKKGW